MKARILIFAFASTLFALAASAQTAETPASSSQAIEDFKPATTNQRGSEYPNQDLAALYWRRWGQETFYGRLKGRMDLENCSGLTLDAVEQDFAATVLLSNVESVVIGPAAAELAQRTAHRDQPAKINRAVSIHALKTRLIELLSSRMPAEQILAELTQWFQRSEYSAARSYHYQRYVRKTVF